ncbi:MAG TPA: DUF3093 domain-containing protein [Nocardioidaceae bacterium]|nr:DUF3093 domain-containing protein [Nocardioidaceae bacterium]
MTGVSPETSVLYDERLHVPLRWWVQAIMALAIVWLAFIVSLPPAIAWVATGVLTAAVSALLLGYGSARVRIEGGVFHAGRAHIPVTLLADPNPLDREGTRLLAGRDADARAYLLLRPYLKRAVRVAVTDPADPAPYWLISTRRPEELARALSAAGLR